MASGAVHKLLFIWSSAYETSRQKAPRCDPAARARRRCFSGRSLQLHSTPVNAEAVDCMLHIHTEGRGTEDISRLLSVCLSTFEALRRVHIDREEVLLLDDGVGGPNQARQLHRRQRLLRAPLPLHLW